MRWLRWARRDRRLALLIGIDLVLALVVIAAITALLWPSSGPAQSDSTGRDNSAVSPSPGGGFEALTPSPALPTVNPTRLAALPNQGQSEAPPPPPGLSLSAPPLSGLNALPTPTLSPKPGQ